MTALRLSLIFILSVGVGGTDSKTLVGRLGAPKYADRQAASAELEKIGRDALGDLKQARAAKDAEVRSRASFLVERIENELMVRPTEIRLDFHDQPLSEVVKAFGLRSQVTMGLFPENARDLKERKVSLERSQPVPFWEALDLLCRAGDVQYNTGMPMGGFGPSGSRAPTLNLYQASTASHSVPTCSSGPFRLNLTGIQFHRERNFTLQNNSPLPFPGGNGPIAAAPSGLNEQFFAGLQILAEPRLNVALSGPIKLIEAIDDRGQSLMPMPSTGAAFRHNAGYNRYDNSPGTSLAVQIPLRYPDQPGRSIRRLRGTVPLAVSSRKDEPLAIPLVADSRGKSFKSGDMTLTLAEIRNDAPGGQPSLEMSLQSNSAAANSGAMAPEFVIAQMLRTPGNSQNQLEITDAQGRPIYNWYVSNQNFSPEGLRITIQFLAGDPAAPARLRFYELAKTATEADFVFENVEMP